MATVDSNRTSAQRLPKSHGRDICRLTIVINGIAHIVHPTDENSVFAAVRAFRLREVRRGSVYVVAQTLTGIVCDCPASQGTTNPPCKHVRALVAAGLLDNDARPARLRLDTNPEATLSEHVHNEAHAYRAIGTPLAKRFANTMDALSLKITLTQAATPDEYEPRIDALEADIRER
jgi:SWIM zinc finger